MRRKSTSGSTSRSTSPVKHVLAASQPASRPMVSNTNTSGRV